MARRSVQCTHQGMFRGHSPTGKQMIVTGIVIERIVNGKASEAAFAQRRYDGIRLIQSPDRYILCIPGESAGVIVAISHLFTRPMAQQLY